MANEFIARKGLISLGDSQVTGSLETTSNLNVEGSGSFGNNKFLIGTVTNPNAATGFNSTFEFQNGPSTYSSQLVFRPKGNTTNYNANYWGSIRWNPGNESGLTILAGNYKTNILFGRGAPSSANPQAFAKLNNDGLRLQSSYVQSIATAEEKLHVVGNAKITGFVTASGNLITEANITASGHVSASTYYGDGSNLTNIPSDFPYTGSAIISGSLEVIGNTIIDGKLLGPSSVLTIGPNNYKIDQSTGGAGDQKFYLSGGGGWSYNWYTNNTHRVRISDGGLGVGIGNINPDARLHIDGTTKLDGDTTITGSNSLAGNYALKVTNTSGADILNVENDGNVGIGIDNPTEKLHVHDGIVHISDSSTNNYIDIEPDVSGAPRIRFFDAGARDYRLTFASNRFSFNSGIQITSGHFELTSTDTILSDGKLQLRGTDTYVNFVDAGAASRGAIGFLDGDSNFIYTQGGSTLANGTEQFRIASSGNVGIGVTNPQTNLHVSSSVSASTYYGDGSNLTGIAGISFNGSTANGLVTYGSATTADVESKLTFSNSNLFVESTNVASGGIKIFGGTYPVANAYISPVGIFTTMQFGDGSTGHIFDLQNNKLAFDADSTNTYIQADTDTPENLEIHADGNIELRADDELQIFSDTDVTGNITASGDLSISGFPSVSSSLALATTSTFTYARAIMGNDVLQGGASQQDFNSATAQKVKFNTSANTAGAGITIDTTNNRITVLITGYYQITANLSFFSNSARTTPAAIFKVNGTTDLLGEGYGYIRAASGQNDNNNLITCVVELQANDFVEVYVGDTSGVSGALYATQAFFEIGSVGGSIGQTGTTGAQGPSGTSYDVVEITGDTTLSSTYTTKYLVCNSATAIDITVPQTASYDQYAEFVFEQRGAGVITIVADTGVTINSTETLKSSGQYSVIGLKRTDSNMYTLTGEREVTP